MRANKPREIQRVVVSGSSGLIGRALVDHLRSRGREVVRLVRREARYADEYRWDPYAGHVDPKALIGADAVINLSGAGIGDGRWTEERKKVLYDSRILTTTTLANSLVDLDVTPAVFVSQSAVGIYGDRGDEVLTESSSLGPRSDFLASLTMDWEAAAEPARQAGVRVVHPRTGLVLARDADLMKRLVPIFKAGLGGPIGNGRQWWSWITLRDVVAAIDHLLSQEFHGPANLTAPNPVRQSEFADVLGDVMGRPSIVPVPKFAMKLVLGSEKADGIGLSSARVTPGALMEADYSFHDEDLRGALESLFQERESRGAPVGS